MKVGFSTLDKITLQQTLEANGLKPNGHNLRQLIGVLRADLVNNCFLDEADYLAADLDCDHYGWSRRDIKTHKGQQFCPTCIGRITHE